MVINDLDVVRVPVHPPETNAPLIINADTVLSGAVAAKLLEPVTRRNSQVIERTSTVDNHELLQHRPVK